MGTSSEGVFNGSGKGYLPAGTIGNQTHILSERLKAGTEFKRLKKGYRPAPMPLKWTHILSYKPPIAGSLSNQWWAMRDVRVRLAPPAPRFVAPLLACCAGKRFAFPQLRTLSGSNPMRWAQTKTVPLRGPFPIQWWAMRDSNPQPCACKAPALTVAPIARAERV